jgi:hypothetical protein
VDPTIAPQGFVVLSGAKDLLFGGHPKLQIPRCARNDKLVRMNQDLHNDDVSSIPHKFSL